MRNKPNLTISAQKRAFSLGKGWTATREGAKEGKKQSRSGSFSLVKAGAELEYGYAHLPLTWLGRE